MDFQCPQQFVGEGTVEWWKSSDFWKHCAGRVFNPCSLSQRSVGLCLPPSSPSLIINFCGEWSHNRTHMETHRNMFEPLLQMFCAEKHWSWFTFCPGIHLLVQRFQSFYWTQREVLAYDWPDQYLASANMQPLSASQPSYLRPSYRTPARLLSHVDQMKFASVSVVILTLKAQRPSGFVEWIVSSQRCLYFKWLQDKCLHI